LAARSISWASSMSFGRRSRMRAINCTPRVGSPLRFVWLGCATRFLARRKARESSTGLYEQYLTEFCAASVHDLGVNDSPEHGERLGRSPSGQVSRHGEAQRGRVLSARRCELMVVRQSTNLCGIEVSAHSLRTVSFCRAQVSRICVCAARGKVCDNTTF
jgi:hypothetical protein